MSADPELRRLYRERRLIPFIGAGFSRPLGLPLWNELVEEAARQLGFEPDLFALHGGNEQLLGYLKLQEGIEGLVAWMRERFHSKAADEARANSVQHRSLAALTEIRTIYTTNYEHHIERALEDAERKTVVRVSFADFSKPLPDDAVEVVKFHGDLETAGKGGRSLVLTEADYFDRLALESPCDQRLRADLLGNAFLFMGYRFDDRNTRYIWHRMHQMAQAHGEKLRHHSYYVTFEVGEVQRALLRRWGIKVVELDLRDPSSSISDFLSSLGAEA